MTTPEIGFIGLGLMGAAMVGRLQDRGYALTVLGHRNRAGVEAAVGRGATEAATARDLAAASDIVMLCMGTSDQVESRMRGPDGVIAGLRPGAVVIDFGTSLPASTRALGEEVAAAGGTYLDAPLGRTPSHAKDGKLNIMAAGDTAAYERVRPVLDDLGENVFHLGPLGSGHTIKLINNFFAMTSCNTQSKRVKRRSSRIQRLATLLLGYNIVVVDDVLHSRAFTVACRPQRQRLGVGPSGPSRRPP